MNNPFRPLILICAAGHSRRMHPQDKLLLKIGAAPLLRHIVKQALNLPHDIIVALPDLQGERFQSVQDLPCKPMQFENTHKGLSHTLHGGAHYAQVQNYSHLLCLLADLPHITPQHLTKLLGVTRGDQQHLIWQAQAQNGTAGHPIIFARSIFSDFQHISGDTGAKQIVKKHEHKRKLVKFETNAPIADLDTPQDLANFPTISSL